MTKAEKTKQFIIEQAATIINEKGISGTSIDDVLKAAKVAKGCLYNHFESKDELSLACVDYLLGKLTERRDALICRQATATEKLHAFMEMNKNALNSLVTGGCPIVNLSTESDDTNPVIKKKLKKVIEGYNKLFIQIIQEGIDAGEFSNKINAEEFAFKMFTSIEGAGIMCRIMNSNKPMHIVISSLKTELETFRIN